ncbi:Nucleic acid-binding, OB-fold [Sesbania bispinosa]|nr:Nucleic acid-binding, OB-fold [Sesbania bispinosa]
MAMVPSHFHSIKSLCGLRQNWRLRVKLVRVWNMASIATPNDPFATQMVLIDEEVNLWGQIRLDLFGEMIDVVAGYLGLPRWEVGIQNVMNASKVYWNPDMPEAVEFRNGLAVHEIETDVDIRTISEMRRPASMKDDFLKLYPKRTLEQLHQMEEAQLNRLSKMDFGECYAMLHKSCRDMLAEIKGVKNCDHPSDISNLVGNEFLFRVERKNHASFTFEECFRVKRVCSSPSIIADYKIGMDKETPLKLKFAPSFTKIIDEEATNCVKDITPELSSVVTEIQVSPFTTILSPSDGDDGGSVNKREAQQSTDGQYERKKRPRQKVIKVEKN